MRDLDIVGAIQAIQLPMDRGKQGHLFHHAEVLGVDGPHRLRRHED